MQQPEESDMDGDPRPATLVHLPGKKERPRLAWRPWLRGFVLGAVLGAALVFGYFLWRMATMPDWAVPARYGGK